MPPLNIRPAEVPCSVAVGGEEKVADESCLIDHGCFPWLIVHSSDG
jgi:hypothetical protein